jgi:phosphohistidine phosphatase
MKQLLLLRHAEAEPVRSGQTDAQRSLTAHGRMQALQVAQQLRQRGLLPDALLTSPSTRTLETAQILIEQLALPAAPQADTLLYGGSPDVLLARLRACPPEAGCLLLIGHNPALSALAQHLAGGAPLELATAGLCHFEIEAASWAQLDPQVVYRVSLIR